MKHPKPSTCVSEERKETYLQLIEKRPLSARQPDVIVGYVTKALTLASP